MDQNGIVVVVVVVVIVVVVVVAVIIVVIVVVVVVVVAVVVVVVVVVAPDQAFCKLALVRFRWLAPRAGAGVGSALPKPWTASLLNRGVDGETSSQAAS